jgi:hypothetical protein
VKATTFPINGVTPHRIGIVERGGEWLSDELAALSREGYDVLVSMLTSQQAHELGLSKESEECSAGGSAEALQFF